jgi:hypothetical protein
VRTDFFIAEEDCNSRSLVKSETPGMKEKDDDDEMELIVPSGMDDSSDKEATSQEEADEMIAKLKSTPNEYLLNKEKNIAEIKKIVEELKMQYPIPEDMKKTAPTREPKKRLPAQEPVARQHSQRNKDKTQPLARCVDML